MSVPTLIRIEAPSNPTIATAPARGIFRYGVAQGGNHSASRRLWPSQGRYIYLWDAGDWIIYNISEPSTLDVDASVYENFPLHAYQSILANDQTGEHEEILNNFAANTDVVIVDQAEMFKTRALLIGNTKATGVVYVAFGELASTAFPRGHAVNALSNLAIPHELMTNCTVWARSQAIATMTIGRMLG